MWLAASPVLLFTPYWVTNHWHLRAAQPVGLTDLDHLIPFMPGMTAVYLLLFPMIWVAMWVQPDRRALHRWMLAAACCCWVVAAVFVIFPTSLERPAYTGGGLYGALIHHDHDRNISPSLHGTFACLSVLSIAWARGWRPWGLLAVAFALIIAFATVAVRQHGILDLFSGACIGLCAAWWWRRYSVRPAGERLAAGVS